MLPKKERISRKKFNEIYQNSKIIARGSFFMVKFQKTPLFSASVVVPKKIAKKATERNRIKRAVYTLFSQKKSKNKDISGSYIVIFQKKPIQNKDLIADFEQITFI